MFVFKMSRKVNLSKIATKNLKNAAAIVESTESSLVAQSSTLSPYFSPIAGRTRNNRKNVENATVAGFKSKSNETNVTSSSSSSSSELVAKIKKNQSIEPKGATRKHIKVEYDENEKVVEVKNEVKEEPIFKTETDTSEESTSPVKQVKWEPNNWRQLLANIREMRKERNAPVDTMGCDKCYDEHSDEKTKRFHHLVALMLSSQTKDSVTYEAMSRLKRHGLTPEKMIATSTSELEQLLYPVGFYKTKAKNIQKTSQVLIDKFGSDIPNSLEGLVSLPGIGPKCAHICMRVAWNIVTGIGVDTHVHRIANRLKWVPKETKEPEQTRIALEKWLPYEDWTDVNELLVGFGQSICTPTNPRCSECLNASICPASSVKKTKKNV
ncbi:endonuclease III-like protein 1 isoform X2 [Contarinia nasturtii]|uniref:endonuclease III-like protein 1 isoform X2 n=1 Tax=Contarinia nasturtii TaxID=265458 RepID=UPI0012D45323|nr:endonuclease III-like protein 1 isoform X2 [Contarinia nasturtii]